MKENKYWWITLILETIFILMLLNFSKELVRHGFNWIGNIIKLLVLLFIFYGMAKNFNELMK